jgi:chemotaxis protein histidine kinase CheA
MESFLKELQSYLPEIEANLDRLQRQLTDGDALEEIYRRAHTIAGSAAMMEVSGIAAIAAAMENVVGDALDQITPLTDQSVALLRRSVGRLRQLLDLTRAGKDDSTIVQQDRADFAATRGNRAAPQAGGLPRAMGGPGTVPAPFAASPTPPPTRGFSPLPSSAPSWANPAPVPPSQPLPPRSASPVANPAPVAMPASPARPLPNTPPVAATNLPRLGETPLWQEVVSEEEVAQQTAAALVQSVAALRDLARRFDGERTELMTFLDGSNDALERLEQWAGQAMGIDLRTSPDHVRRYLPLSVLWVVTARMKQVLDLLQDASRGLVVRQEALTEALGHLREALQQAGQIAGGTVGAAALNPDGGFTANVAQFSYAPPTRAELAPGQRAELEHAVREELRRELEDEVRDEIAGQVRRDEERRLRQELKIELRRELLAELSPTMGSGTGLTPGLAIPGDMGAAAPRKVAPTAAALNNETLDIFRAEAEEHLRTINDGLSALERNRQDGEAIRSIRRAMHTLKGAAAITGFDAVADLAHLSEDLLDRINDGAIAPAPDVISLMLDTSQALEAMMDNDTGEQGGNTGILAALRPRYQMILGETIDLPTVKPPTRSAVATTTMPRPAVRVTVPEEDGDEGEGHPTERSEGDLSVRLPLRKLDELLTLFGDIIVNRSVVEERMGRLMNMIADSGVVSERLREVGLQLETQFEAALLPSQHTSQFPNVQGMPPNRGAPPPNFGGVVSGPHAAPQTEFDPLELDRYSEFHRISRGLTESVADAMTLSTEMESTVREMEVSLVREGRMSSIFQDALVKARLVPLSSLVPRLYRAIRAVAIKYGKEFELLIEGDDTEIDRGVFEDISAPLLHVVRNAIYHGIETPDERLSRGKPAQGQIVLSAHYEGNQLIIAVRDDGAGINPAAIRATAQARGLIDSYTQLNDREIINLIFQPGFSTAETITEEAGRGVGLDVVRDTITRLRGGVEVDSTPGKGSTFILSLPISLQIQRVVLARVGDQVYAVPMNVVEQIVQLDYYPRNTSTSAPALDVRGERYPLLHLASYLNLAASPVNDKTPVLLINSGTRRWGLMLDAVAGRQEIVAKSLGPHLRNIPAISGATVLGNGQVVLILDPLEMLMRPLRPDAVVPAIPPPGTILPMGPNNSRAAILGDPRVAPRPSVPAAPQRPGQLRGDPRHIPYILVVDDSPSVRRVVSTTLKNAGWDVMTARDGLEALEIVAQRIPVGILLDIEMPRMDGYELMAALRNQPMYQHIPLIVLTSRAATKHQQRALQLGADAYVVKPYQDDQLLQTIGELIPVRPDGSPAK